MQFWSTSTDLCNLRDALKKWARREEALLCVDRILAIEPNRTDILIKRAQLLHNLGRRENALQCAQQAVEMEPGDLAALNMHGMILDDLERRKEALADFLAILKS